MRQPLHNGNEEQTGCQESVRFPHMRRKYAPERCFSELSVKFAKRGMRQQSMRLASKKQPQELFAAKLKRVLAAGHVYSSRFDSSWRAPGSKAR